MKVFILTGAGISAESGAGTFRDPKGFWATFDPMKLATPEGFAADPDQVHAFYNARRRDLLTAEANDAHRALTRLEQALIRAGGGFWLCTQNIDDLHERAGTRRVHHMHGELLQSLCAHCGGLAPCRSDLSTADICRACGRAGGLRPDVVWFGETPYGMEQIEEALVSADVFAAIGTSGTVYPAAGFAGLARAAGIETWLVNLEIYGASWEFDHHLAGRATQVVPEFVTRLLGRI